MSAPDPGPNFSIIPGHQARIGDSAWDSSVGLWVDWNSSFGAAAFVARRKDAKRPAMTDKAALEEIAIVDNIIAHLREAIDEEVHDDGPCAKPIVLRMMEIPAKTLLRHLEICREQAARIKRLEKQIEDDNELSKKQYGY